MEIFPEHLIKLLSVWPIALDNQKSNLSFKGKLLLNLNVLNLNLSFKILYHAPGVNIILIFNTTNYTHTRQQLDKHQAIVELAG
jgi:hypothetical protein